MGYTRKDLGNKLAALHVAAWSPATEQSRLTEQPVVPFRSCLQLPNRVAARGSRSDYSYHIKAG